MDKKLTWKDYFNVKNIRNYAQGHWNKMLDARFNHLEDHIKEQALYRANLCKPCYDNGKCTECGCSTPVMFFSPSKVDAKGKWGKMLNKEQWETFKKENELPVKFAFMSYEEYMNYNEKQNNDEAKGQDIQNEGGSAIPESSRD
jgi:hypothetical protein